MNYSSMLLETIHVFTTAIVSDLNYAYINIKSLLCDLHFIRGKLSGQGIDYIQTSGDFMRYMMPLPRGI